VKSSDITSKQVVPDEAPGIRLHRSGRCRSRQSWSLGTVARVGRTSGKGRSWPALGLDHRLRHADCTVACAFASTRRVVGRHAERWSRSRGNSLSRPG